MQATTESYRTGDEDLPSTCTTCKGTGFILCDHEGTPRDDGWCGRCSAPADEIKARTWCDCQTD
jgi:hypothetical protein